MKLFSKMLSKKLEPNEMGELEQDLEKALEKRHAKLDDSGEPNSSSLDVALPESEMAPEVAEGAGWGDEAWDEDWDDDDDWGAEDDPDRDITAGFDEKEHLVNEIREAVGEAEERARAAAAVEPPSPQREFKDWTNEGKLGRRIVARSQLGETGEEVDRMFEQTASAMTERETSRRRSAMAHLKAAAAATKADRVLKNVASRDPAADPEEQSPYRDDLAKVVRPHATSRPISRTVSRPTSQTAVWDTGMADDDAAKFAAAEDQEAMEAQNAAVEAIEDVVEAEAERINRAPLDLSEDEFAEAGRDRFDAPLDVEDEVLSDAPVAEDIDEAVAEEDLRNAFAAQDEPLDEEFEVEDEGDDFEDDHVEDTDAPVPSSVVSAAVAYGQGDDEVFEDEFEDEEDMDGGNKIWDVANAVAAEVAETRPEDPENIADIAAMVSGRAAGGRTAGRVKTRLLGFQPEVEQQRDVFEEAAETASTQDSVRFPAGWIVVISGPGRGASFTLHNGVSQIGRGEDQAVRLDFGDTSISRNNHAAVAYDDEEGKYYLGHGGKSNLVRLNNKPVLSTEEMHDGDEIRIGETRLKFVALCGENFTWKDGEEE